MGLFTVFNVSGSGMMAESERLAAVASNLANANSQGDAAGHAYLSREVVFRAVAPEDGDGMGPSDTGMAGVRVVGVVTSNEAPRTIYDPGNKFANAQGYVETTNVNPIDEMVNMISAQQNYQADLEAFNVAKTLMQKTLTI